MKLLRKKDITSAARLALMRTLLPTSHRLENTVILTGLPRSGTTWLGEIVNTIPRSAMLFEPLHLRRVPEAKSAGFSWATLLESEAEHPEALEFIERILRGQFINEWIARDLKIKDCLGMKVLIVKFVRAQRILEWMVSNFPIRRPLYIIRHPCAVVASQVRLEWKTRIDHSAVMGEPILRLFPHLTGFVEELETIEERLAAKWCLGNYYALSRSKPYNFELVTYEQLVTDGPAQLERIFTALGFPVPEQAISNFKSPSVTTHFGDPWSSGNPINNWTKILDKEQIKRILDVVESFGMNFYTEDLEPDYNRLYGDTSPILSTSGTTP